MSQGAVYFEGFRVGDRLETLGRTVGEYEISSFVALAGFTEPLFMDLEYDVRVLAPVLAGDTIRVEIELAGKRETRKPDRGVVTFRHRVLNQRDEAVMEATITRMIKRSPA